MLSAKIRMEGVNLAITPRIVGCVRVVVPMNGEPLILCRRPLVMLTHPGNQVSLGLQRWRVAHFVEQQELLGLDSHAAPTERARIAKLRAVTIGVRTAKHVLELVGAERDQDGRQLGRIKIAEAQSKAEPSSRL